MVRWSAFGGPDVAIDLGTANTLIWVRGRGLVLDEPTAATISHTGNLLAVGAEAKRMLGRTPRGITVVRPLRDGAIDNMPLTEQMLRYFMKRIHMRQWLKSRIAMCAPTGVTGVERRALCDVAEQAGARRPVQLIEEPLAAAIGAGLAIHEPAGHLVVGIGGGTTEVAMISLGGIVASSSCKVGGDELDDTVIMYCKQEYGLVVGAHTAERAKIELGSAWDLEEELYFEMRGTAVDTGLPKSATLATHELREAFDAPLTTIIETIHNTLEASPPELCADLVETGVVLTGGGATLRGLPQRISRELGLPVRVADDARKCVLRGVARSLG